MDPNTQNPMGQAPVDPMAQAPAADPNAGMQVPPVSAPTPTPMPAEPVAPQVPEPQVPETPVAPVMPTEPPMGGTPGTDMGGGQMPPTVPPAV